MKKAEFKELLDEQHRVLCLLTSTKGEEYSRSDDQLGNFKRSAMEAGIAPEQVWLVFYNKHADAIKHYVRKLGIFDAKELMKPSEPIEGRIDDAILYLILLKGLLRDRDALSGMPHG